MAINLTGAQAAVERLLLVDACRILKGEDRTAAGDVWDNNTGNYTPAAAEEIFAGGCQVTPASRLPADELIGGMALADLDYVVNISKDAVFSDELMAEDVVEITAVHDGGDPLLVGKIFVVRSFEMSTYSVLRNIGCSTYQERPVG